MPNYLNNKRILVGITGGIAAYKAAELVRMLKQRGANVRVVMTEAATTFITPMTLQALSAQPVHTTLLDEKAEAAMGHIELAKWADRIIVAPASAGFIARIAQGQANDLLTTLCLASKSPLMLAPAMNQQMWASKATQDNIEIIQARGIELLGPAIGEQACGDIGLGRMIEPDAICEIVNRHFSSDLCAGMNVLITAGSTQEAIDPVRYLSNHSSGKMAYALAEAFIEAGASVTLVSGPTNLTISDSVNKINVISALDMLQAVKDNIQDNTLFIAAAAVSDYRPVEVSSQKIKKNEDKLTLEFIKNPDILKEVAVNYPEITCIGFAAETNDLIVNAKKKLHDKKLSMVIANQVGIAQSGFQSDDNKVSVITKTGVCDIEKMSKKKLARILVEKIADML